MPKIKEITPEYLIEKGKTFVLEQMPPEERLAGISAKDRMRGIQAKDRMRGISAEDRLKGLNLNELSQKEKKNLIAQLKASIKNGA